MSRAYFRDVVLNRDFRPTIATITVYEPGTTTPLTEPIYADNSSGTTKSNPFTTNDTGEFEFFLSSPRRVDIKYSKPGYIPETKAVDVVSVLPLAPIVVKKSDASLVLTVAAASAFTDSDPGGSAAARPLDLVVPGVRAGQWVTLSINAWGTQGTAGVYLDFFTIVAGVPVGKIGPATTGLGGWLLSNTTIAMPVNGQASYQVQGADIENGAVRFRLRHAGTPTGGTARLLYGAFGTEIRLEAHGPKG